MVWIVLLVTACASVLAVWAVRRSPRRLVAPRRHPAPEPSRASRSLRGPRSSRRASPVADPFEMLTLQFRLSTLAAQIQRIEQDQSTLARAHHLRATQYAYDTVLRQACTLVGLDGVPGASAGELESDTWIVDEQERMRQELELCERGWSW